MGSAVISPPVVKAKAISCPNCGGPVELRGFAHTLSVVCPQCLSVLDTSTPEVALLQRIQGQQRIQPTIPLGTRGKFGDTTFEVIGFQIRRVQTPDGSYEWSEYLLFHPYKGFRYLSEYQGHWNFIRVLSIIPEAAGDRVVNFGAKRYRKFDTCQATTVYVLGEFPWQVRVGETVRVEDFVAPPQMLSAETTQMERTWSLGEYWTCTQIWQAFKLPGSAPRASGIFANQPSPSAGKVGSAWRMWLWMMVALVAVMFLTMATASNEKLFEQRYSFAPGGTTEPSFVTSPFEIKGKPSNLEIDIKTNLNNDWAYFNLALINEDTGHTLDFGREVSNYSDEGSPNNDVLLPKLPPGKYSLRVEPEMAPSSRAGVNYDLIVRRDVPTYTWFWIAAVLLLLPPIFTSIRSGRFETARWAESDYAPKGD
jgi:hypothetical protein